MFSFLEFVVIGMILSSLSSPSLPVIASRLRRSNLHAGSQIASLAKKLVRNDSKGGYFQVDTLCLH